MARIHSLNHDREWMRCEGHCRVPSRATSPSHRQHQRWSWHLWRDSRFIKYSPLSLQAYLILPEKTVVW
ncbi:unnamed protein product [Linum tenue]|uniref:Uncharacterized protein n=1 Tax=Linum tenue TaxID=586396 RepID=A0AAV0PUU4_9ROSI|nr:unnamed protein product [Linum tenue]